MIRMVCKSCGIEKYYDSYLRLATYLTWSSHKIQTPEMKETNTGLVSHTDRSFIIILHQNQVNSFEVKAKDDEWFNIDFSPSSFSHRRWCSNGVYKFVSNIYIYIHARILLCARLYFPSTLYICHWNWSTNALLETGMEQQENTLSSSSSNYLVEVSFIHVHHDLIECKSISHFEIWIVDVLVRLTIFFLYILSFLI